VPVENIDLTIEGKPGDEVQVWYRGDREIEEGDLAPIIYTGRIGSNGRVIVSVPRAYLVLGRPVRQTVTTLPLHEETAAAKTVRLSPATG
jgi:hypothetical protein